MFKKTTTRTSTVLILSVVTMIILVFTTTSAQATLLAYYPFNNDFTDASGNHNDLTIATGTPTITNTAGEYVFGSGALDADSTVGTEEYLNLTNPITFGDTDAWSIAFWVRRRPGTDYRTGMVIGDTSNNTDFIWTPDNPSQVQGLRFRSSANMNANFGGFPDDQQFHHWVVIADGAGNVTAYRDNVSQGSVAITSNFSITSVAAAYNATTQSMDGQIDELCIYDEAIDAATVDNLYNGEGPLETTKASKPSPDNGATDVYRNVILSWTPGLYAPTVNGHIVYLSENLDDVDGGVGGITQDANSYTPAQRLDFGKTYYWRVDEVNAPPDKTVFKGKIWSFTVEPVGYPIVNVTATASSSDPGQGSANAVVDGSGLSDDLHSTDTQTMWLSDPAGPQPTWIEFEFDKVYVLHEMWVWNSNTSFEGAIGYGFKDVTIEYSADGVNYMILGTTHEFAQATGTDDYAHNTTIDFGGRQAKYVRLTPQSNWKGFVVQYGLSEVRFLHIPLRARSPKPDPGATDVDVDTTLSFRAGREASTHNLYLSTDEQAVIDGTAPVETLTEPSYAPSLDLAQTYFWKVVEVNQAEEPSTWESNVWDFKTQDFLAIDDFESYNDIPTGEEGSKLIYETWSDGFGSTTNGSTIGYTVPFEPTMESGIVHSGSQSVPVAYDNTTAPMSEVTVNPANLDIGSNWTGHGTKGLTMWFYGDPCSTPTQMYVKVNGVQVPYVSDAENLQRKPWQFWYVDLNDFAGTDLTNVTEFTIGFQGGKGTMLFDDIALSGHERELVTPVEPTSDNLLAHYAFEGNTNDSVSGNAAAVEGAPIFVPGQTGQAIQLNGANEYLLVQGSYDLPVYTAALWFRVDGGSGNRDILSIYDYALGQFGTLLELTGAGELRFLHRFPIGNTGGSNIYAGTYDDGGWYHVVIMKSAEKIMLYVNGILVGTADDDTQYDLPLTALAIGVLRHDNLQRYFPGAIDEVYLYNRLLSEGEIAWLAGRTKPFDKP